jgi:hypothetical protein
VSLSFAHSEAPTKQQTTHSWAIYRILGGPAKFIGIVYNQPDQRSAIKAAIEEFKVPPNLHNRLIAQQRRD